MNEPLSDWPSLGQSWEVVPGPVCPGCRQGRWGAGLTTQHPIDLVEAVPETSLLQCYCGAVEGREPPAARKQESSVWRLLEVSTE